MLSDDARPPGRGAARADDDPYEDARPAWDDADDENADGGVDGEDDDERYDEDDEDDDGLDAEERALLDEAFPLGDGVAAGVAEVWCPYCGEPNEVALDPGGGSAQEYVEDCQVCCQPWRVRVTYLADGTAAVSADPDDGR